jgi:tetratricopeptide (TPR) repeat protein
MNYRLVGITLGIILAGIQAAWAQPNCDPNVTLSSAAEYTDRGRDCVGQGSYTQENAIADFNQAIALDPNYARAYNNRAASYEQLGDLNQAVVDYTQAIALAPAYVKAYDNRGWVYYVQTNYSAALADFNQALQLDAAYDHAYVGRANVYAVQERYDLAYADYQHYVELVGDSAPAWVRDWIHSYENGTLDGRRPSSGSLPLWIIGLLVCSVVVIGVYVRLKMGGKHRARPKSEVSYTETRSTPES